MKSRGLWKVTVLLPRELVHRATEATGLGVTPTIRRGLETVTAAAALQRLRQRRGKIKFPAYFAGIRED